MPVMNIIQAVNDALRLEMRRDPNVVVLGEDVGKFGGVFRATQGLQDEFADLENEDAVAKELRELKSKRAGQKSGGSGSV